MVVDKVDEDNQFQEIQIFPNGKSERNFQKCLKYDISNYTKVNFRI